MADPQQNYRNVLARLEAKDKEGTSAQDLYDAASFLPGTGEAIAAYELPGILSQSGKMMSSDDFLEAAAGTGLATLGVASVLPGVGPVARYAKKGIEGFIPYIGPKTAVAGGPDIDTSVTKIIASEEATGGSEKIAKHIELSSSKKKKQDIFKENKTFVDPLDNKISFEIDTRKADLLDAAVQKTDRGLFGSHYLKPNPNQEYGVYKLDELLTGMDDLFKQYPDLKDAYVQPFNGVVEHNGKLVQAGGAVDFQDFVIKLGPGTSQKNLTEKLLHETQHLVDFLEGRQPGGTPLMFSGTAKQNLKNYRRLSGEVRARLVQDRFFYNLQDEFPKPDTSPKKVLNTEDDIMEVGGQSFEGAKEITKDLNLGSGSLFAPQSKKGRQLLILSCSETKCPDVGDMKAVDRYLGPVFQSLKKQGVKDNVDVAILSAKHGLIRSDTKIKDYDQLMDTNRASEFKKSPDQMDRIKNTLDGYDKVVVQGGKNYKDVIRAASGDANVTEIPPGRGIGDQRRSVKSALAFSKIDTPVYHYTLRPGFTKFDKKYQAFYDFGPHVGSTPKSAEDRFISQVSAVRSKDGEIVFKESPFIKGDESYKGGSLTLQADLSKPFLNPKTDSPFTENELIDFKAKAIDKIFKSKGYKDTFTRNDLLLNTIDGAEGDKDFFPEINDTGDIRKLIEKISQDLAKEGFTHVPYINKFEDKGALSYEMLVDRPKGSTKVLQSPSAAKDPDKFDDPDFMMEEGGVVSLKDRAVNMTRRPQGIEPFIKFVV